MVEFNKMFVMIPVMLAARKLNGEDPTTVYWLRIAYGTIQTLCILIVAYTYWQASSVQANQIIYVPQPAVPFADPQAKKKYTEISYRIHVLKTARSLVGSTLFGLAVTTVLHYYRGMVMGLAIQAVMAPFNLIENPLVVAIFTKGAIRPQDKVFKEKTQGELTPDEEVIDEHGQPVTRRPIGQPPSRKTEESSFEDILLDTWDAGSKADITDLMKAINKENSNFRTKEHRWTPLMILGGLGAKGTGSAIRQVIELGGRPDDTDDEGWNALHWAAFHGSLEGARELRKLTELLTSKDKEGKTPLETALKEGNDEVAKLFQSALDEAAKGK